MANISFNIYFNGSDGVEQSSNVEAPKQEGMIDPTNPARPKNGAKQIVALATIASIGKTAVNFGSSRVEMFTGSEYRQEQANFVMKGVGYVAAIAVNPLLGLGALAIDLVTQVIDYNHKTARENLSLADRRERAGLSNDKTRF